MQQPDGYQSTTSPTIVSETALNAVLQDIRNGESYPNFFDHRYEDDEEQEPVLSVEVQEVAQ